VPQISDTQLAQCRVGALMVESSLQDLLWHIANPPQDRTAIDNADARITVQRTLGYQQFAAYYNNLDFHPTMQPDVSQWLNARINVAVPSIQQTWIWVAETVQHLKTTIGRLMRNFNGSGKNANGADDVQRDLEFLQHFCNGNPVYFFVYMAWDHGRNMPQWNSSLLPPEQSLDLGAGPAQVSTPAQSSTKRRRGSSSEGGDASDMSVLVRSSQDLLHAALQSVQSAATSGASTSSNAHEVVQPVVLPEQAAASKAAALSQHANVLREQLKATPNDDSELEAVRKQIVAQLVIVLTQLGQVL